MASCGNKIKNGTRTSCPGPVLVLLHVALVSLDHFLDHLAADAAGLTGGQVAVIAFLQVDAYLPWCSTTILKMVNSCIETEFHLYTGVF